MLISKSNVLGRPVVTENKIGHLPKCVWGSISLGHFFLRWYWYFNVKLLMCSRIWIHNTSYLQDERFCLTAYMIWMCYKQRKRALGATLDVASSRRLAVATNFGEDDTPRSVHLSSTSIQNFLFVFLFAFLVSPNLLGKAWNHVENVQTIHEKFNHELKLLLWGRNRQIQI